MAPIVYSKYPDFEERTPREVFTQRLRKICARLDAEPAKTLTYKSWPRKDKHTGHFEARALWVAGSYARGASTCGDLDLIFQAEASEGRGGPGMSTLAKAFLGSFPAMRVYAGTPEVNSSGLPLPDAVLVWQPGMDWEQALSAIRLDPQAGRFPRPADEVVLRVEQLRMDAEDVAQWVTARDEGTLRVSFVPLSAIEPVYEPEKADEAKVFRLLSEASEDKRKLAPIVVALARHLKARRAAPADMELPYGETAIRIGGVRLYPVNLSMNADALDELAMTCIAGIPALSTRGPNGALVIERGPRHPVSLAFAGLSAWIHVYPDGKPSFTGCRAMSGFEADKIEVFASQKDAHEWADELNSDLENNADDAKWRLQPARVGGDALLELFGCVDVITTPEGDIPVTHAGLVYCRGNKEERAAVAKWEELAQVLKRSDQTT